MTELPSLTLALAVLLLLAVVVLVHHVMHRVMPRRQTRRLRLLKRFEEFAIAVCTRNPDEQRIEAFWRETTHTYFLFTNQEASSLRADLHDRALRLVELRAGSVAAARANAKVAERTRERAELQRWFVVSIAHINKLRVAEETSRPSIARTLNESLLILGSRLRA